jgi:1-deoxy-D-xylulose-5-phosphate reductoisomerase
MIETIDGAIYPHMSVADMALPIMNALTYPKKLKNPFGVPDLAGTGSLNFYPYDETKFPSLSLCRKAGITGGSMPAVLNAANEMAVNAFLDKKVAFTDIVNIVEKTMEAHVLIQNPEIEDIYSADRWGRDKAESIIKSKR